MSHFTPQKTTSPQLTHTNIDLESIYTSAPIGLCLLSTDTQYLRVNQQIADIDGCSIEHHIGKKVRDLVPDLAHTIEKLTQKVVATGEPVLNIDIEGETPTLPGVTRYWKTSLWPVKNDKGQVSAINVVAEEITEHKRTEEPLRAAIAYNRGLIEASLDPLVTISSDGKISDVNEATVLATGVSREDLIGTDFSSYFTNTEKAKAGYEKVYRDGAVTDYELEIRHKNGRTIPVLYNATIYRDESGAVAGVFAAARDITKWKKAEVERSRLAAIVDDSDDAIIGKSLDGMIVSWNNGAERLYGYTAAEAIGRHISFLLLPDQVDDIDELFDKIKSGHSIFHYETGRMREDGTTVQISLSLSPIRDRESVLIGASTIARDITQRTKAEEVMRRVSAYNRSLIEASLDPLVTINSKGKISDVNNATVRVTGVPRGDLIGTDFSNYFTEPDRAKAGYEQAFRDGSVTDYELQLRHQDGSITPVLYNATVFRDELGNLAGVFAAARDITERKRAEEALRESTAYNRS
ncbi:MAG: PAS domain S-box protein, partial [Methanobacteriota archaeon]